MDLFTYESDTPPPALFGFDLFGLLSFRLWLRSFTLAILPRWLLHVEANLFSRGPVLTGRIMGRGFYGEMRVPLARGRYPFWAWVKDEEGNRYFTLGRLWVVVDPRQEFSVTQAAR